MEIGKLIQKARKEAKLTQTELAQKMGLSRMMISRYEVGLNNIPLDQLEKIAKFLNKPVTYFLEESLTVKIAPKELLEMLLNTIPQTKEQNISEIVNEYTQESIKKWFKKNNPQISYDKWLNTKIKLNVKPTDSTNYELSSSTDYTHK